MSSLLFMIIYLGCLILPGLAIHRLLNLKLDYYLSSLSLSYSLFALTFIVSNHYSVTVSSFLIGYLLLIFISSAYLTVSFYRSRYASNFSKTNSRLGYFWPIIGIALASGVYQILFGSFTEVPVDLYAHLERYQAALAKIDSNSLGRALGWKNLLLQDSGVFYYLIAGISWLTKLTSHEALLTIDFLNRSLFLIAVFHFSRIVFKGSPEITLIAILTTAFVALHLGINVFAFIRYYTLAPTMLNMILYLFAIVVFLNTIRHETKLQEGSQSITKHLTENLIAYLIIVVICIATAAIHVQELMFIVVMIATISVIASIKILHTEVRGSQTNFMEISKKHVLTISILAGVAFIFLYIYSQLNFTRAPNADERLWEFTPSYGYIPSITTLNLKFQFSKVMTLWGLLVYFLFFLNINRYKKNLFILAGMLSPIVTILNPFFIDLFLRHYNSTTVWRLCYLIPVHFVAADLFVHYIKTLREYAALKKVGVSSIIVAMVVLLLPIENTWRKIHYSRFPTLGQSDEKLSQHYYQDLITNLESLEHSYKVLTDPVTGYMVSAMTQHRSTRNKFFRDYRFKHFTLPDYSNSPLRKYRNHLLIVNKREKNLSRVGRLSEHWAENQWSNTDRYYPPRLLNHLSNNPSRFELLWSGNNVQVYKVL